MCVCVHVCFLYIMAWDPFSVTCLKWFWDSLIETFELNIKALTFYDHTMSHKVFLLPGMIYALPSPNIAYKNCISVDSMETY